YLVGNNGLILKKTDAIILDVKKTPSIKDISYVLNQNFPNPFNPATTITYQLPKRGSVILKIFDILGNEVRTLVNENKEMGRYTIRFDASSLASGMYVYQLRVNDYTSAKKMLLIK
ncbi:MAG: T9SS type A sorting domain-containing protein, partial [Ignavibacteria bacterium]|nr:T9SS type A sorting domain-containing protein [Ignavibacteria bacterium]